MNILRKLFRFPKALRSLPDFQIEIKEWPGASKIPSWAINTLDVTIQALRKRLTSISRLDIPFEYWKFLELARQGYLHTSPLLFVWVEGLQSSSGLGLIKVEERAVIVLRENILCDLAKVRFKHLDGTVEERIDYHVPGELARYIFACLVYMSPGISAEEIDKNREDIRMAGRYCFPDQVAVQQEITIHSSSPTDRIQ